MKMLHCQKWQLVTEKYFLLPYNNKQAEFEVLQILNCIDCGQSIYQLYSLFNNGKQSQPVKISRKNYDSFWRNRILEFQPKMSSRVGFGLYTSSYSYRVSRPADVALRYLKAN